MNKRSSLVRVIVVVGVVLLFGFIALTSSYRQIDFGSVGMVTRFGRITGRIMEPGLNWKAPFVDRVIIPTTLCVGLKYTASVAVFSTGLSSGRPTERPFVCQVGHT